MSSKISQMKKRQGQKARAPGTERRQVGVGQDAGTSGIATTSGTATTQNLASPPHKKFKGDPQYLQAWDEVMYACGDPTLEGWGQFYEQWWGSASAGGARFEALDGEGLEERAILVGDAHIQQAFELLEVSNGWMIVRDEYARIYHRLSRLFEAKRSGVVLTGNPGIGKSYFAIYTLLRRMTEGKTTLFTTSDGYSYLFHETGIRLKEKAQVRIKHLPDEGVNDRTSRAWSVIDGAADGSPEVSALTTQALFVLITSSSKEERYKEWKKQRRGLRWVMNPWSEEELRVLLSNPHFTQLLPNEIECYKSAEGIQRLVEDVGPCPRDILDSIATPRTYEQGIREAFAGLNLDKLIALFYQSINPPDSIPHRLTLLQRADDLKPLDSDDYLVDLKSEEICRRARNVFKDLSLKDCKRLFAALSDIPAGRRLAGVAFEPLAKAYIRGSWEGPKEQASVFCHFQPMVQISPSVKWPYRFAHRPSGGTIKNVCNHPLFKSTASSLPIIRMDTVFYNDVETFSLAPRQLYCPDNPTNPMFDSFFIEDSDEGVILWVFQMTIATTHDGKVSGFDILKTLEERMKSTFQKSVTVNFVLVITYTEQQVMWNLPKDLKDFEGGGVYVLCLHDLRREPFFVSSVP